MLKLAADLRAALRRANLPHFTALAVVEEGFRDADSSTASSFSPLTDPIIIALVCAAALLLLSLRKTGGKSE